MPSTLYPRPEGLRRLRATAVAVVLGAAALTLQAATPVVEILAYAHPPVQAALKPLRDGLARQAGQLRVVETDLESPEGARRFAATGLKGHVPIVVLVDGQYRHARGDGSTVEFLGFPAGPGTPPGVKGTWSQADVEAALKARKP